MYDMDYWTRQVVGLVIRTLILVLFLLTLRGLLRRVDSRNRAMRPDLVWLNLIPFFDYAWIFVTLVKVRDSVRAEWQARGWGHVRGDSFVVGLISAVLYVAAFALSWLALLAPGAAMFWLLVVVSLASIGFWVSYWVRISRLKQALESNAYFGAQPAPVAAARCPSCGSASETGDEFCRACGSRVSGQTPGSVELEKTGAESAETGSGVGEDTGSVAGEEIVPAPSACPFCGADYRPDARFCSVCGRPAL